MSETFDPSAVTIKEEIDIAYNCCFCQQEFALEFDLQKHLKSHYE